MITWGVSANEHDASLAVIAHEEILFASHSERFSRKKNDSHLNEPLLEAARAFGEPERIVWYEKPFPKRLRKAYAGQPGVFRRDGARYLKDLGVNAPVHYVGHHEAHAAAGFYTSPFHEAAVLVVDAIGEWDTVTLWEARGSELKLRWSQRYPHSLGLLYSAFTQRIGFKPNEEEYIVMGASAYGSPDYIPQIDEDLIANRIPPDFKLRMNVHKGIKWWRPEIDDTMGIAASIQAVTEEYMVGMARWAAKTTGMKQLVLGGGVALNCVANSKIALDGAFDDFWIFPNPGDAGSSIGAVAALERRRLNWVHPYLGYDIQRPLDEEGACAALVAGEVVALANGRAEFGPRALGNRSLLADPRGPKTKDRVNRIKKREMFRPFAPVIMAEHAHDYFQMPIPSSPYMQFVAPVKRTDLFPAISHVDGTARVQTVTAEQNPAFYKLLERFFEATGCPMLLNTSLNIKGEPLVNSWDDALRFSELHGVKLF